MDRLILWALVLAVLPQGGEAARAQQSQREPLVERVRLQSATKSVSVSYSEDVSLQRVFGDIGEQAGVTVLFDEAFRDEVASVNLGSVSVQEALDKLTAVHRIFYKVVDPTTVILVPDNAQKHRQHDELLLHTFYVAHADVQSIANMFRTLAGIQRVQPDTGQKSISVRATADQLLVAQSILERNDAPPAEVAIRIEVLAVGPNADPSASVSLTTDELASFKNRPGAELLMAQTVRLVDGTTGRISIEEGTTSRVGDAIDDPGKQDAAPAPGPEKEVGLRLSFQPQVSAADDISLSVTLRATVPIREDPTDGEGSSTRSSEVATTMVIKPDEITIIPSSFRVVDFGRALVGRTSPGDSRDVVVAIGASILRGRSLPKVSTPLSMGTEQIVRVPLF